MTGAYIALGVIVLLWVLYLLWEWRAYQRILKGRDTSLKGRAIRPPRGESQRRSPGGRGQRWD
jgi:hypothetical protein